MQNVHGPKILKLLSFLILPLFILAMQFFNPSFTCIFILLLISLSFFIKKIRRETILLTIMFCGYLIWIFISTMIKTEIGLNNDWTTILTRFGLFGYLLFFFIWYKFHRTYTNNFCIGNFRAEIKLPFIWYGVKDNIFRLTIGFSLLCIIVAGAFAYINSLTTSLIILGIIFAIVNSLLEEVLWRGFILSRTCDLYGEKAGLIVMSLAFGFYHYSLGFSIPLCLVFSLGGIYFGGAALRSKGLLSPIIMHISMNFLFVSIGIIF